MIHSVRPIVTPVANIVTLFCFARFRKVGTYGRTMIPISSDFGLAEWINCYYLCKLQTGQVDHSWLLHSALYICVWSNKRVSRAEAQKVFKKLRTIIQVNGEVTQSQFSNFFSPLTPPLYSIYSFKSNMFLIHSAGPQSRPVVIIVFAHVVRPSVCPSTLFKSSKTKQQKIMVATGETVGLAEWIINDTCLVFTILQTDFSKYFAWKKWSLENLEITEIRTK